MIAFAIARSDNPRAYDRAEFTADALIHLVGCCLGLAAAAALLSVAFQFETQAEFIPRGIPLGNRTGLLLLNPIPPELNDSTTAKRQFNKPVAKRR